MYQIASAFTLLMVAMAFSLPVEMEDKNAAPVDDLDTAEFIISLISKIKKATPVIMADMVVKCTKLEECSPIFDRVVAARQADGFYV